MVDRQLVYKLLMLRFNSLPTQEPLTCEINPVNLASSRLFVEFVGRDQNVVKLFRILSIVQFICEMELSCYISYTCLCVKNFSDIDVCARLNVLIQIDVYSFV